MKLKIKSLKGKNYDRDIVMLHACFQVLNDFIEKEKGDKFVDYETHKAEIDEIRSLYKWWKKRSKTPYLDTNSASDKEDDLMLQRLIKIRSFLWT